MTLVRFARRAGNRYDPPMRWLLYGKMTPAVGEALKRHEHTVVLPASIDLPETATPQQVVEAAKAKQLDIMTTDASLIEAVFDLDLYLFRSMVYLQLPGEDVEQDDAIDRLFKRYKRLTPDRLYTVTENRVKIRQLPSKK